MLRGKRCLGVLLAVWVGVSGAAAGLERGKLIVKVTVEGAKMLEGARGEAGAVLVEKIPEGPLKTICKRYGVSVWEPLFPKLQAGKVDSLGRVYRLRFGPSVDVSRIARDFEGLPDWVEYAEPDRRMEVQYLGGVPNVPAQISSEVLWEPMVPNSTGYAGDTYRGLERGHFPDNL